jgi:capsular polysaccharide biosynthesis protein
MDNKQKVEHEAGVIDLAFLFKIFLKRAIIIIAVALIVAFGSFGYTKLFVQPQYSSSTMLYVNNRANSSNSQVSASELSAAQSLVDTYVVILSNKTTMEMVKEKAGIEDSWQYILGSVKAEPVEGTEVFEVTVTTNDAVKSQKIAQAITEVLPDRIIEATNAGRISVVDKPTEGVKVSPNVTKNTLLGFIAGFVLSYALFVVTALIDDTIRDADYLTHTYDKPLLAQIPGLTFDDNVGKRGRYYSYYYYKRSAENKE